MGDGEVEDDEVVVVLVIRVDQGTISPVEFLQSRMEGWKRGPLVELDAMAADQISWSGCLC